ncbi:MAG: TRAP transporter small permease subunit [Gammaproteobacteria bacterium]
MGWLEKSVWSLSVVAAAAAALILLAMVALILSEIVLRTFFDTSTHMMDEIVGYGIGAMSFLALGYSLEHGALIRMNLLLSHLDDEGRTRQGVEVACCVLALIGTGMAVYYFASNAYRDFGRGYTSGTLADVPLWIPKAMIMLGLAVFWLQMLVYMLGVISRRKSLKSDRAVEFGFE